MADLDWKDIWRHALSGAEVTLHLRVALDNKNIAVARAAAEALTATLGESLETLDESSGTPSLFGKVWALLSKNHTISMPKSQQK